MKILIVQSELKKNYMKTIILKSDVEKKIFENLDSTE